MSPGWTANGVPGTGARCRNGPGWRCNCLSERINLGDLFSQGSEFPYATVLRPDGTHEVVEVNPLAATTSDFWTSPTTGKRYGTRWTVNIPALDASLTIVVEPHGQEVQAFGGLHEGAGKVTGRYRGKPVSGKVYVEQVGIWR